MLWVSWPVLQNAPEVPDDKEAVLVTQANMDRQVLEDYRDQKATKGLKEIRGPLGLKAIKDLKDPRATLANPSQLLPLCYLHCQWW